MNFSRVGRYHPILDDVSEGWLGKMRLFWKFCFCSAWLGLGLFTTRPAGFIRERLPNLPPTARQSRVPPDSSGQATPNPFADQTSNQGAAPAPLSNLTPEQLKFLKEIKPNEMGVVPIVEYHDIWKTENKKSLARSIEHFKHDLERMYKENYRPISLSEYLDNKIDLPAGKSPVVLTFDDARRSQFSYLDDGTLDPDCALAILKAFHEKHSDFALKGMFFILPRRSFDQKETAEKKLHELVQLGFELGNHTVTHPHLNHLSDAKVQWEIATCSAMLKKMVPEAKVDTLAFPGGNVPKNKKLILNGKAEGSVYTLRAAFLAAGAPAPPPLSKKLDVLRIVRIVAVEGDGGLTDWLDEIQQGLVKRYVSDGDSKTLTTPTGYEKYIDKAKLNGMAVNAYDDKLLKEPKPKSIAEKADPKPPESN